ncbi:tonB-system energizer ExbB [Rhodoplanes sp. Z2-YC6860]|uniref:tonB-system energizer ExbB n=1 Tax=Rhodoplanes sp. Z2-YC6860 TaxID=674703 RepID=UPI00078B8153|nr:tonB-system energizer ExbB [Rhodoplanes sp. Z2-YC6860]AMN43197.1 TonB-system energizer ExbB type-1 [Rhodoplanes sp. Z2-YC6860]
MRISRLVAPATIVAVLCTAQAFAQAPAPNQQAPRPAVSQPAAPQVAPSQAAPPQAAPAAAATPAPATTVPAAPAQSGSAPATPDANAASAPAIGTAQVSPADLPRDLSPWGMFMNADIIVKLVMIGLVFASLVTWTVCVAKYWELFAASRRARAALGLLNEARSLGEANQRLGRGEAAIERLVRAAVHEVQMSPHPEPEGLKERIAWLLERVEASAIRRTGRGMGILATIGATAPFVGLFGTVWGIMNSFIGISNAHTTNLAVVAPGIAEALLATALGLFAAIPAVVIYNVFSRATGGYRALLADGSALVMRLVSRDCERMSSPMSRAAAE